MGHRYRLDRMHTTSTGITITKNRGDDLPVFNKSAAYFCKPSSYISERFRKGEQRRKKEHIWKRHTSNHDFDDGCQRSKGFSVTSRKTRGKMKKKKKERRETYHYPPFPTTLEFCRRRFASHHRKNYDFHIHWREQLAPIDKFGKCGEKKQKQKQK